MLQTEILLVDDAKIFLDIQKEFLKHSLVRVTTAYNGLEALQMTQLKRPDLVVMDVAMPHLDGVSCCISIKSEPELSSIPVILISTKSGHDDIASYKNAGCSAILHKPLQRREYLNRLHEFLPAIERREPRTPCRMPATVKTGFGTFPGTVHDIAMNGLFLETGYDLKVEGEIVLSFRLSLNGNREFVAKGRIAWRNNSSETTENGLPRGYGIEFLDITCEDAAVNGYDQLESFMATHSSFGRCPEHIPNKTIKD